MQDELFLGIPGVDTPYPKHVQDALDFIEEESKTVQQRVAEELEKHNRVFTSAIFLRGSMNTAMGTYPTPPRQVRAPDDKFIKDRRKQKAARQKERPYQPYQQKKERPYSADEWPSW